MGRCPRVLFLCLIAFGGFAASPPAGWALTKDQSRIEENDSSGPHILDSMPETPSRAPEPTPEEPPVLEPDDVPAIATVELTDDSARRAIDGFAAVNDRYNDRGLDEYDTLEEFVEKTDAGKELEAEIKKFGFPNITQWNTTIMAVSFAYSALDEAQEKSVREQIEEVRADKTLDESTRTRMIASLNALIPSTNNKEIVRKLTQEPAYAEKLKLLEEGE
ncbi:MAG: hypothetical protein AB7S41_04390 [Parvibaculaceae bacterium]